MKVTYFLIILFCLSGCSKDGDSVQVKITGIIHSPGITIYQYGTHELTNSTGYYALKSESVNLDAYYNQTITVYGVKVIGYPIDGGPELIDVTNVVK